MKNSKAVPFSVFECYVKFGNINAVIRNLASIKAKERIDKRIKMRAGVLVEPSALTKLISDTRRPNTFKRSTLQSFLPDFKRIETHFKVTSLSVTVL